MESSVLRGGEADRLHHKVPGRLFSLPAEVCAEVVVEPPVVRLEAGR